MAASCRQRSARAATHSPARWGGGEERSCAAAQQGQRGCAALRTQDALAVGGVRHAGRTEQHGACEGVAAPDDGDAVGHERSRALVRRRADHLLDGAERVREVRVRVEEGDRCEEVARDLVHGCSRGEGSGSSGVGGGGGRSRCAGDRPSGARGGLGGAEGTLAPSGAGALARRRRRARATRAPRARRNPLHSGADAHKSESISERIRITFEVIHDRVDSTWIPLEDEAPARTRNAPRGRGATPEGRGRTRSP